MVSGEEPHSHTYHCRYLTPKDHWETHHVPLVKGFAKGTTPPLDTDAIQAKKAVHTRWLSHDQAITVLRRTLSSVLTTLEREEAENDEAVARGLVSEMKTYNFIATVYLLSDVLPVLTQLNLVFQTADVDVSVIKPQVHH